MFVKFSAPPPSRKQTVIIILWELGNDVWRERSIRVAWLVDDDDDEDGILKCLSKRSPWLVSHAWRRASHIDGSGQ